MSINYLGQVNKRVSERFKIEVDFSPWMSDTDTILTLTLSAVDDATDVAATVTGVYVLGTQSVTFEVLGGTATHAYTITVRVTTADSCIWDAYLSLLVD